MRQLGVLITLAGLIRQAHVEMISNGLDADRAAAVATYLGMGFGRLANSFTRFCRWQSRDQITIAAIGDRQALKMVYDFSEINPFAETAGCLPFAFDNEAHCIKILASVGKPATVTRCSAEEVPYENESFDAVVTDPPYYSSIFYSDLSSFFYVWLRRIVGDLYPEHFVLASPPKRRRLLLKQASTRETKSAPKIITKRSCSHLRKRDGYSSRTLPLFAFMRTKQPLDGLLSFECSSQRD